MEDYHHSDDFVMFLSLISYLEPVLDGSLRYHS